MLQKISHLSDKLSLIYLSSKAYRTYEREFKTKQGGQVGITLNSGYCQPEDSNDPLDVLAAERCMALYLGWWADPIYGSRNGGINLGFTESQSWIVMKYDY